ILAIWLVYREVTSAKKQVHGFLTSLSSLELSDDSREVIEKSIEELMHTYRCMIPMGETFLKGELAERIKEQASMKIFSILPNFQRMLIHHAIKSRELEKKVIYIAFKLVLFSTLIGATVACVIFFVLCLFNQIY